MIAELDGQGGLKAFYVLGADAAISRLAAAPACSVGIHNAIAAWLVTRWALPRNGRRLLYV